MTLYPYDAGNMIVVIPISKFADLHDKIKQLEAENARLRFEIEVHREGWDSNDAWEYHCKFEVAKMYAKRDALKPDSDPNTPPTAV
jgi:hypothetical protein